jgi:hypothetical protein
MQMVAGGGRGNMWLARPGEICSIYTLGALGLIIPGFTNSGDTFPFIVRKARWNFSSCLCLDRKVEFSRKIPIIGGLALLILWKEATAAMTALVYFYT